MVRITRLVAAAPALAGATALAAALLLSSCGAPSQRADNSYDTRVAQPAYGRAKGPRVVIDEAHRNFHTATGRYKPFASLITNDGYRVASGHGPFTPEGLKSVDILLVSNAFGPEGHDDSTAFSADEVRAVRDWVENGGSFLFIADHWPCGGAAAKLSEGLGVEMSQGVTEDSVNCAPSTGGQSEKEPTTLLFSRENGLLQDHPVTNGRRPEERIQRVVTFTGQSLSVPAGATALLKLGVTAADSRPLPPKIEHVGNDVRVTPQYADPVSATGRAQGVAFELGKGRVVILGEAAMMTAQVSGDGHPFGMNVPGNDNRQLALNILHWLSRLD